MVSKSPEANFVSLVGGQYEGMSYGTIRRLSVHGGKKIVPGGRLNKKNGIKGMKMEHV
jgi:disease resistance protein RPM1